MYCQFFILGFSCKIKKGRKKKTEYFSFQKFFNGICCLKAFVQVSGSTEVRISGYLISHWFSEYAQDIEWFLFRL